MSMSRTTWPLFLCLEPEQRGELLRYYHNLYGKALDVGKPDPYISYALPGNLGVYIPKFMSERPHSPVRVI